MFITEWNFLLKELKSGLCNGVDVKHEPISQDFSKIPTYDPDYSQDYQQSLLIGPFKNVDDKTRNFCLKHVEKILCKLGYEVKTIYSVDCNMEYWNVFYKWTPNVDMHISDEEDLE